MVKKKFPSERLQNITAYYQPKTDTTTPMQRETTLENTLATPISSQTSDSVTAAPPLPALGGVQSFPLTELKTVAWNARKYYDPEALAALANDLQVNGQIEPLLVRKAASGYEIISGERRFRAAQQIGLPALQAVVIEADDHRAYRLALAANLERADLNAYEETLGYLQVLEVELMPLLAEQGFSADVEGIRAVLSKMWQEYKKGKEPALRDSPLGQKVQEIFSGKISWQSYKSHRLPLLDLPEDIQKELQSGTLDYGKARILIKITDAEARKALTKSVISEQLSLRDLNKRIKDFQNQPTMDTEQMVALDKDFVALRRKLKSAVLTQETAAQVETLLKQLKDLLG